MTGEYHINITFPGNTIRQIALVTALKKVDCDFPYLVNSEGTIVADYTRKCKQCGMQVFSRPRLQMQHILNGDAQFKARIKVKKWVGGNKCQSTKMP